VATARQILSALYKVEYNALWRTLDADPTEEKKHSQLLDPAGDVIVSTK
jgi:hypothetical protein